jgi:anion-transporting  ArsA/GET3 family ATPase
LANSPDLSRQANRIDSLTNALDELLKRRVIALMGKGGVGRTSVGAALAVIAAGRGMRTLVMETDPRTPIADSYGARASFAPIELAPNLWAMFLGGQESLEDYLGMVVPRPLLRAVFASSLYQYFVQAAPAVRELTMMGKIYHEIVRRPRSQPRWDIIIFDAPASGQALSMLRMPFAAGETFGASMVGREAADVARFFRDGTLCAMVAVTTAEPLAIAETLELSRELEKLALKTAAVVFNRVSPAEFETADIMRMMRRVRRTLAGEHLDYLAEIARAELRRRNRERRALEIVRRQIEAPTIELRERRGLAGRALVAKLAGQLGHCAATVTGTSAHPSPERAT